VLIVAHGISLDSCTRQLVGQQPRSQVRFSFLLHTEEYVVGLVRADSQFAEFRRAADCCEAL
jgi:hypothetical protein